MTIPVFECVTLVASNDTANGGSAVVSCRSDPFDLDGAEFLCVQVTIDSIWGAGTNAPKLMVLAEFSTDGLNFGDPVSIPDLANLTTAATKNVRIDACGETARLFAAFELDTSGTTGPGAVTFGGGVSTSVAGA